MACPFFTIAMQPAISACATCCPCGICPRRLIPIPRINLPAELLPALTGHYLYARLNEVLYSSLMAENRQRHAHMDSALKKLDEDSEHQQAYNAQRQEDITEEIEVILLSAGMLKAVEW